MAEVRTGRSFSGRSRSRLGADNAGGIASREMPRRMFSKSDSKEENFCSEFRSVHTKRLIDSKNDKLHKLEM